MPSLSGIYRLLKRHDQIDPKAWRRRDRTFRRWERGSAMELWQMDVVGGILLADGTELKALTGIDDHSRFVVCAGLMRRANALQAELATGEHHEVDGADEVEVDIPIEDPYATDPYEGFDEDEDEDAK